MFKDLFTFTDLHEACAECFGFEDATMLRDFGPLKKGQIVKSIWFKLEESIVEVWLENDCSGTPDFKFPFQLEAKAPFKIE